MKRHLLVALSLALLVSNFSLLLAQPEHKNRSRDIATQAMAEMMDARWQLADTELLVGPLVATLPSDEIELIINSRLTDALALRVEWASSEGEVQVLYVETLPPRGTLVLPVGSVIQATDPGKPDGSIRLSYFGDAEMVQAWLVTKGVRGVMERPLDKTSQLLNTEQHSFFDLSALGQGHSVKAHYAFHNTLPVQAHLQVFLYKPDGSEERHQLLLPADGTVVFAPAPELRVAGMTMKHDGLPGQVAAVGVLSGPRFLARLPFYETTTAPVVRESMSLSAALPDDRRAAIHLHNRDRVSSGQVEIQLLEPDDGDVLVTLKLNLAPGAFDTVDLRTLLAGAAGVPSDSRYRLRVSSPGSMLLQALEAGRHGNPTDIELIPQDKVHDGGTYPIPSLLEAHTVTEFLNLGVEPAQIFAHLSWSDRNYALTPFEVPPGGTYTVDFRDVALMRNKDLAGRYFKPGEEIFYFQWLGRRGSSDLIARTRVRPEGSDDSYGFNCFGCCEEFPYGAMEPEFAAFLVGTTVNFLAAEYIQTCSGTIGPFYANPNSTTYSSPLGWNTSQVWSAGETTQTVSFTSYGSYMQAFCKPRTINFFGDGPAVADEICQQTHNPGYDPNRGCCGMFGSDLTQCTNCCDREKAVADCRCDKLPLFKSVCKAIASLFSTLDCHGPCAEGCGDA